MQKIMNKLTAINHRDGLPRHQTIYLKMQAVLATIPIVTITETNKLSHSHCNSGNACIESKRIAIYVGPYKTRLKNKIKV